MQFFEPLGVKFALMTMVLVASVAAGLRPRGLAARSSAERGLLFVLRSLGDSAIRLVQKTRSESLSDFAANAYRIVKDESPYALIAGHLGVVRALNRDGAALLARHHPRLTTKYLGSYLALSLSKQSRREIVKYHYRYLQDRVNLSFYRRILNERIVLWQERADQDVFAISMSFNAQWHYEGDLSLTLDRNGAPLYEVSFTVVPGELIDFVARPALLVTRVQGARDQVDEIKTATRACHDVAPPHLLLAAIQAVAGALGIETVGGVSNGEQLTKSQSGAVECYFDYDAFWESFVVKERGAAFYELSVPFASKPLRQIKGTHRRRTRHKREFKDRVAAGVGDAFADTFLKRRH